MHKLTYSLFLFLGTASLLSSCQQGAAETQANDKAYKIGVAYFSHETCTFCPQPTGIEEFEYHGPPLQGEEVLDYSSYIRGFVEVA